MNDYFFIFLNMRDLDLRQFSSVPKPETGLSEMAKALQAQVPAAERKDASGKIIVPPQPMSAEVFKAINDWALNVGISTQTRSSQILSLWVNNK
jgi:hypothetical protein